MRKAAAVAGLVLAVACASRQPPAPDPAVLRLAEDTGAAERADARLLAGCYTCLVDARDTFKRLSTGPIAERARAGWFEAAILVVLREKEFAVAADASVAEARAAAAALPAAFDAGRILAMTEAVPPEIEGLGRLPVAEFRRAHLEFARRSGAELTWLETSALRAPARAYLSLAVRCAGLTDAIPPLSTLAQAPGDWPLVNYKRNTCRPIASESVAEAIRAATPDFVDTSYGIARSIAEQMVAGGDGRRIPALLTELTVTFPRSPAVAYLEGYVAQAVGDCAAALEAYERTVSLSPRHEAAWMGRTVCFTSLGEARPAIDAATSLIALGSVDFTRDAFYWRAVNHHALASLTEARADIEDAKRRGAAPEIYSLAGMIEYDQDDLDQARIDLERAWALSRRMCGARSFLGLVHNKRQLWLDAARAFDDAVSCNVILATEAEASLRVLEAREDLEPARKERQVAQLRASAAESRRRARVGALNAATSYANGAEFTRVDALILIAAEDPSLLTDVESLRTYVTQRRAAMTKTP